MITSFSPNFLVFMGVYLINNVVIVSGGQLSNSAIHIHVSILPQTPLPSRLPHVMETDTKRQGGHLASRPRAVSQVTSQNRG